MIGNLKLEYHSFKLKTESNIGTTCTIFTELDQLENQIRNKKIKFSVKQRKWSDKDDSVAGIYKIAIMTK